MKKIQQLIENTLYENPEIEGLDEFNEAYDAVKKLEEGIFGDLGGAIGDAFRSFGDRRALSKIDQSIAKELGKEDGKIQAALGVLASSMTKRVQRLSTLGDKIKAKISNNPDAQRVVDDAVNAKIQDAKRIAAYVNALSGSFKADAEMDLKKSLDQHRAADQEMAAAAKSALQAAQSEVSPEASTDPKAAIGGDTPAPDAPPAQKDEFLTDDPISIVNGNEIVVRSGTDPNVVYVFDQSADGDTFEFGKLTKQDIEDGGYDLTHRRSGSAVDYIKKNIGKTNKDGQQILGIDQGDLDEFLARDQQRQSKGLIDDPDDPWANMELEPNDDDEGGPTDTSTVDTIDMGPGGTDNDISTADTVDLGPGGTDNDISTADTVDLGPGEGGGDPANDLYMGPGLTGEPGGSGGDPANDLYMGPGLTGEPGGSETGSFNDFDDDIMNDEPEDGSEGDDEDVSMNDEPEEPEQSKVEKFKTENPNSYRTFQNILNVADQEGKDTLSIDEYVDDWETWAEDGGDPASWYDASQYSDVFGDRRSAVKTLQSFWNEMGIGTQESASPIYREMREAFRRGLFRG